MINTPIKISAQPAWGSYSEPKGESTLEENEQVHSLKYLTNSCFSSFEISIKIWMKFDLFALLFVSLIYRSLILKLKLGSILETFYQKFFALHALIRSTKQGCTLAPEVEKQRFQKLIPSAATLIQSLLENMIQSNWFSQADPFHSDIFNIHQVSFNYFCHEG